MEDIRISIRLSKEQHKKLKILAIEKEKSIQDIMKDYIDELTKERKKKN